MRSALLVALPVGLIAVAGCRSRAQQSKQQQSPIAPVTTAQAALISEAETFVDLMAGGDFEAAVADFDATMTKVMPPQKLKETWETTTKQAGDFQQRVSSKAVKDKGYDIVFVTCQFEGAALDVRVVFDSESKVTGLWFAPADMSDQYSSPDYVKPDTFAEVDETVGEGDWQLPGTLSLPKGDGPFPGVVLVHGSGPQDRDETIGPNKPFRDIAGGLASRGIAVLRYEKRTKAHAAKMIELQSTFTVKEETVDDALVAAALLRSREGIDPKRVYVLGHSLGGMVAPRIGIRDPSLAGLIIMAGNTRPLPAVIVDQIDYLLSLSGELPEEARKQSETLKAQARRAQAGDLSSDTPAAELPFGAPAAYWLDLRNYSQTEMVAKLKQPILVLQGGRDYQVTKADFDGWKSALAGRGNATLKFYGNLNHLFAPGEGMATPDEYAKPNNVDGTVIDDIAEWIGPTQ